MKSFVFLYPIPEIIDFEIKDNGWRHEKGEKFFRKWYGDVLNKCIDIRYRQNGFDITYAVFDDQEVSDVITLREKDKIIKVGLDFKTHIKEVNGKHPYPDNDFILDQLGNIKVIRIAGFHMWDCVEKLAKRAHERGLDTLVDEDLTEFFGFRMQDPDFIIEKYPSYNPKESGDEFHVRAFMKARINKPWLWQDY